jgi:hypothetical protein
MQAIAQINYLATLDHMTYDKFTDNEAQLRVYEKIFNDESRALQIYEAKRKEYNDLSNVKPLRIRITEGTVEE